MAKVSFNMVLKDLRGKPFEEVDEAGVKKTITLGGLCFTALNVMGDDERNLAGAERYKRFQLQVKIVNAEEEIEPVMLTAEEITLLKTLIGKRFSPQVVGVSWDLLDPPKVEKEHVDKANGAREHVAAN